MTGSTSSLVQEGDEKSPSLQVDTSSRSSQSVFTISDENNAESLDIEGPNLEMSTLAKELPISDSKSTNSNIATVTNPTKSNTTSQHATTTLPPIVIHKQLTATSTNGKDAKISKEVVVEAFNKDMKDEGESMHPTRNQSVDFEDSSDVQLRKISCCYGIGVFFILFLGFLFLTSLVIYAGFSRLLQQEGMKFFIFNTS